MLGPTSAATSAKFQNLLKLIERLLAQLHNVVKWMYGRGRVLQQDGQTVQLSIDNAHRIHQELRTHCTVGFS